MLLTAQQLANAEQYVRSLENEAETWRRRIVLLLIAQLLPLSIAVGAIRSSWISATEDWSILKRLRQVEVPKDMPADQWFVAELRRAVALVETSHQEFMLATCEGLTGLLLGAAAVFVMVLFGMRLNQGPGRLLAAQSLRRELQMQQQSVRPQG